VVKADGQRVGQKVKETDVEKYILEGDLMKLINTIVERKILIMM
jgi:hypothetical protein